MSRSRTVHVCGREPLEHEFIEGAARAMCRESSWREETAEEIRAAIRGMIDPADGANTPLLLWDGE